MRQMTIRRVAFVVGAAVLLLCDPGAPDAAPVKIRIAISMPTIGTLPVWIARDRGMFARQDLDVEVIATSGGLDTTALISGSVEFADSVPGQVMVAVHKGSDLKVIAGTLNAITYSVMGRKGLAGLKELRGKKIGVGGLFSGSTLVLHEMLALEGLSYPQDYTLLRVGGAGERLVSLMSAQVDAAILPLPFSLIAGDQGAGRLADAADYVRSYQNTTLMTRGKWAEENPELVIRVLRGLLGAMRWIYGSRDEFVAYAMKKLKIKKEYAAAGWDVYAGKKIWPIDGAPTRDGLETVVRHQIRLGLVPETFNLDRFVELSYLQKAQRP